MASEIKLAEAVVTAAAMARFSDGRLDQLLTAIVRSVLAVVKGDRSALLYMRLLGNQRPSDAKRPVLGEQLELMRSWLPVLAESHDETLQHHAEELHAAVAQADRAQADQRRAEQALAAFSDSGERKAFVDRFNALRQSTHARLQALAEQIHADPPGTELPDDFAEQFFQSSERARTPTLAGLEANIRRLEGQLAKQRALHEELTKKRAAHERVRTEAAERAIRAELAILEKEHSERQTRIDALRSRLPRG